MHYFARSESIMRVLYVLVAAVIVQAGSAVADSAEGADAKEQRVLKFPADRVMGVIFWRKGPPTENDRLWIFGDEWRKVSEARGEVRLPGDGQVRLDINKAASADLSGLDEVDPEEIEALNCHSTDVTDAGLEHI